MTDLFNQYATEEDKRYAKAYHDLKIALDSFEKLNPVQQRRLFNELSVEYLVKQYNNQ